MPLPLHRTLLLALTLLSYITLPAVAQQVGSFFTAIYINGQLSQGETSCSDMGQSNMCCGASQTCAWDDAGQVACCPSGGSCQGSAYYSQTYTSSTWQPEKTTTVYQAQNNVGCNCETSTSINNGNVAVVVPETITTSYTSTTPAPQITVTPNTVVTTAGNCARGYSTIVEANVGAPTRTVGCYVIINGGPRSRGGSASGAGFILYIAGLLMSILEWVA